MKLQALLVQTESWAQEELAAQERVVEILQAQLSAVEKADTMALIEAGESLESELGRRTARDGRRNGLMRSFGVVFGVSPETLSLSSISERAKLLGASTTRLDGARERVRNAAAKSMKLGRKLSVQARYHQGLFSEVVQAISATTDEPQSDERGSWIHVEA